MQGKLRLLPLMAMLLNSTVFASAPITTLDTNSSGAQLPQPTNTLSAASDGATVSPLPAAANSNSTIMSPASTTPTAVPQVVNSQAVLASLTPEQRIARLENQVAYLNTYNNQLGELSTQVDLLRGQIEDLNYQLKLVKKQVNDLSQAQAAVSAVPTPPASSIPAPSVASGGANITPSVTPPLTSSISAPPTAPAPALVSASPDEQKAYQAAYAQMLKKQYGQAIQSFNDFLTQYPNSTSASDVHYWLGDLYLAQGQPDNASQQYRLVVNNNNAGKRPDAMIKLGTILLAYGDSAHAKQLFQSVIKQYPGTQAATQASARLKNM